MERSKKGAGMWRGIAGIATALVLACTACCLPLAAPLLAWASVASLAFIGPVGVVAAAIATVFLVMLLWQRRRRAACRDSCTCRSVPE